MALKIIVTKEEVRERYALPGLQDINDTLDSGLRAAHLHFQGSLGTEWEEVSGQTDVFFLDKDLFPVYPNNQYRFRLKRGFLRASPAPVIRYAQRRRDLTDVTAYTVLDPMYYQIDMEKGILYVDNDFMGDSIVDPDDEDSSEGSRYLAVIYSAGFDNEIVGTQGQTDGTPAIVTPAVYPPPDWLKEAILVWVGSVIAMVAHSDNPTAALAAAEKFKIQAEDMLVHKKRETTFQFLPIA